MDSGVDPLADEIQKLHGAWVRAMAKKLESGDATAAHFEAALKYIQDDRMADRAVRDSVPLDSLASKLPFTDPDPE